MKKDDLKLGQKVWIVCTEEQPWEIVPCVVSGANGPTIKCCCEDEKSDSFGMVIYEFPYLLYPTKAEAVQALLELLLDEQQRISGEIRDALKELREGDENNESGSSAERS